MDKIGSSFHLSLVAIADEAYKSKKHTKIWHKKIFNRDWNSEGRETVSDHDLMFASLLLFEYLQSLLPRLLLSLYKLQ